MSNIGISVTPRDEHDPLDGTQRLNETCSVYALIDVLIKNRILDPLEFHKTFYRILAELDQVNYQRTYKD